jgi:hypothetical protein
MKFCPNCAASFVTVCVIYQAGMTIASTPILIVVLGGVGADELSLVDAIEFRELLPCAGSVEFRRQRPSFWFQFDLHSSAALPLLA